MKKNLYRNIVLGFAFIILIGTFLLMLPISHYGQLNFLDALFTATSAVCVTGLIVKNTGTDFTIFGQIILTLLMQIGGLGFMTFATLIFLSLGKKLSYKEKLILGQQFGTSSFRDILKFTLRVFKLALIIEFFGFIFLFIGFLKYFDFKHALFYAYFHAISAFNNAGFSTFPDSLMHFVDDLIINLTICSLIVLGGLGFIVYDDLINYRKKLKRHLSLHTLIVLSVSFFLIIFGAILFFILEKNGVLKNLSWNGKLFASLFQSITTRTAGFNSVDFSQLKDITLFLVIVLMFIGGAPGSTAGGIKVTTVGILTATFWRILRGHEDVQFWNRRVKSSTVFQAFFLLTLGLMICIVSAFIIADTQKVNVIAAMFEVVSAFATVGLSVGDGSSLSLSAKFNSFGKALIILLMFMGRVGVMTFFYSILASTKKEKIKYPKGKVYF